MHPPDFRTSFSSIKPMDLQSGRSVSRKVNNILHRETQEQNYQFDLTVNTVARLVSPGSLDFGGSEFKPAETETIEPQKRDPDDDYGWWNLDAGTYHIEYNETVQPDDHPVLLVPLQRLIQAGATHPTQIVTSKSDPLEMLLNVGNGGCNLKENCRVTGVYITNSELSI